MREADFSDPPGAGEVGWALVAFAWAFLAGAGVAVFNGWPGFVVGLACLAGCAVAARRWRACVAEHEAARVVATLTGDLP